MSYLLDAHWLMSYLNARPEAVELVERLSPDGISTSPVVCDEVFEGLQSSPAAETRSAQFEAFIQSLDLLDLDLEIARVYGRLRSELRSQGQLIPDNDLWIAATSLAHDLTLVTRDRHFRRIPDLKLL